MKYSVVVSVRQWDLVYYIVPIELEDKFVDMDCDDTEFEYAEAEDMQEVTKEYEQMPETAKVYESEHYFFSRTDKDLKEGMLAKATLKITG